MYPRGKKGTTLLCAGPQAWRCTKESRGLAGGTVEVDRGVPRVSHDPGQRVRCSRRTEMEKSVLS